MLLCNGSQSLGLSEEKKRKELANTRSEAQNSDSIKGDDLPSPIGLEGISQRHCIKYNPEDTNENE